ncbi:ATP-binding protein [Komagataeibacter rhaeticus]|nr:ATP-binding protein [Komagataeibacter rhaeticus]
MAARMDMPVLQKRASDLLDKYVGQSEQQIAAAFAEACDSGAFLIIDEADSLLGDRRAAERSWEISQVNEMLTWMEQHPLPFACTTNLVEKLDPASMRRFLFRARFGYLTEQQAAHAFHSFFGKAPPPGCATSAPWYPSDFALVLRRARLLDEDPTPDELLERLRAETAGRDGNRRIGFLS